jgi:hypothetical protein
VSRLLGRALATLAGIAALAAAPASGHADTITIGLFAPSAPFSNTQARLDFVSKLAEHVAAAVGADAGVGRVYAKASDFVAAARKGDIQLAVVDAPWLAASGAGHDVLAVATRDGATSAAWQLVAKDARSVRALAGKTVSVPSVGGKEAELLVNASLGGEVALDYFSITAAADAVSAVSAVALGRADAACVPAGIALPEGVARVVSLPAVSWPLLVALSGTPDELAKKAAAAAIGFAGDGVFDGFRAASADAYRGLQRRFSRPPRRGPMVVPQLRLTVTAILAEAKLRIERPDAARYFVPAE